MGLGAIFAWAWIPDVQNARDEDGGLVLPSKTLEELGEGLRDRSGSDGNSLGFRGKLVGLRRRRGSSGS
jgi:PHS family inorganic phosphate transporter-like MFS transporter